MPQLVNESKRERRGGVLRWMASSANSSKKRPLDDERGHHYSAETPLTCMPRTVATTARGSAPIVIAASGIYGKELDLLRKQCEQLGATMVDSMEDGVTHLIMERVTWSPKFLLALAGLVPVVSPRWVEAACASQATDPLPDEADAAFAPSGKDGIGRVRSERASLFWGKHFVCLPGGQAHAQSEIPALLHRMGATTEPWPAEEELAKEVLSAHGSETPAVTFVRARAASGSSFLTASDEKWPTSIEAKAAVAAGADVISPLVVRMSLILGKRTSITRLSASARSSEL